MQKISKLSFLLLFACLLSVSGISQGIEFFDGNYKDAFKIAEEQGKLVFVDAYAKWCGPCKRMAATTFKEASVGDFFNAEFINLKIDMEEGQGLEFRKKYPVSAYPTLMFINGKGDIVHKATGAQDKDGIIKLANLAMRKDDRSGDYAKLYEEGNRDYDLVLNYVKSLNKVGKPSLAISNEYIRSKPAISKAQMAAFLFEAATDADSRVFDLMLDHRDELKNIKTEEEVVAQIEKACCKTVEKAIDYESIDLLKRAKEKMKKNAKSEYKAFDVKADMDYYEGIGSLDKYLDKADAYTNKIIKNDADKLVAQGKHLVKNYKSNMKAVLLAEESFERSFKVKDSVDGRIDYATALHKLKKTDKALVHAKQAKVLAKENGESAVKIDRLIMFLESQ